MIKQKSMFMVAALALGAGGAHGQLSLEIDGQTVVPAGELIEIRYTPNLRAFVVSSVHQDWRCIAPAGSTPAVSPDDFQLVFDRVNPLTEPDAVYRIASAANGGLITHDLGAGKISIQTSLVPSEQLVCAPFRASFSSSGFENPLSTESVTPPSPFTAGGVLTIPVTVTNNSLSKVVTRVAVDFDLSTVPAGAPGVSQPQFGDCDSVSQPAPGTTRCMVDVLFPGESRTIDVEYAVDSQTAAGTVIRTESVVTDAWDRASDVPIDVGNPPADVSEVTVGIASGDLAAGLQANDPVAGQAGENVVLSYTITNNAGIQMTSVQSTLAAVVLPSGLSLGSVTPSAGSFSGNQWDVPALAPGQTVTLEQTFTADAATVASEQVCGSFTIDSAAELLVDTGDDSANGCATIAREVDLRSIAPVIKPVFGATEVDAGSVFGIQLQINNNGPSNAGAVGASIALSVDPPDAGVVINPTTSSSSFGTFAGGGSSIDYSVSSEIEPNGITRSADINVDIPINVTDQTTVCLEVVSLSGNEPEVNPGNDLPIPSCITVVNTGT